MNKNFTKKEVRNRLRNIKRIKRDIRMGEAKRFRSISGCIKCQ